MHINRRITRRTRAQEREARDRIGEGGGEAKKRKKPQEIDRRDVENGGDLGGKRKECRQESIGSLDVDPEVLESRKERRQGGKHKLFRA